MGIINKLKKAVGIAPAWTIEYGARASLIPGNLCSFRFPSAPGDVGYVNRPGVSLTGKSKIIMRYHIDGNAVFAPRDTKETKPCKIRLYFQRRGDTLTGTGKYEFFRWWGNAHVNLLASGSFTIDAALDPKDWGSVYGKNGTQAGQYWTQALADVGRIGFTMGGNSFAGHGVYAESGSATFVLESFDVL